MTGHDDTARGARLRNAFLGRPRQAALGLLPHAGAGKWCGAQSASAKGTRKRGNLCPTSTCRRGGRQGAGRQKRCLPDRLFGGHAHVLWACGKSLANQIDVSAQIVELPEK